MINRLVLTFKQKRIINPYFLSIFIICLFLILIYQFWPWRTFEFGNSIWYVFSWLSPLYKFALIEMQFRFIGILLLIPIILAALWYWKACLIITLISIAGVFPVIIDTIPVNNIISSVIIFLVPLLIGLIFYIQLQWRKRQNITFEELQKERQIFVSKTIEIQEEERRRLAGELHDETIQSLLAIANKANDITSYNIDNIGEMKNSAEWVKKASLETADNLRNICLALIPSTLDDLGLIPALKSLISNLRRESSIDIKLVTNNTNQQLGKQLELTLYRIVQEALNNIRNHSKATKASINLDFTEEKTKLVIEDNGQGFHVPEHLHSLAKKGKLGLVGMQERVEYLGGTFNINSKHGHGTSLIIEIKF
ncbi:MAG: sensor histidine kinase [Dehalococcoidales bacterium]|nr:sensor histidine kinase [Dehalococcoidales bacterium]